MPLFTHKHKDISPAIDLPRIHGNKYSRGEYFTDLFSIIKKGVSLKSHFVQRSHLSDWENAFIY